MVHHEAGVAHTVDVGFSVGHLHANVSVPDNAQVFNASGQALRSFRIGDGVEHLAVDEPGTIWVGYFDEGIYSGDPLSVGGFTRFDEYGRQLWTYRPPSGFDHIATHSVFAADLADC
jgi:hypothetical protein